MRLRQGKAGVLFLQQSNTLAENDIAATLAHCTSGIFGRLHHQLKLLGYMIPIADQ